MRPGSVSAVGVTSACRAGSPVRPDEHTDRLRLARPFRRKEAVRGRQVHPARPARGERSGLPPDQVRALPAAWPRRAGGLPRPRRPRRPRGRARHAAAPRRPAGPRGHVRVHHLGPARLRDRRSTTGARARHVAMGGLHVSSMPDEAAAHADSIFIGPGEDTWPQFLADFRRGEAAPRYVSKVRTLADAPPTRRDLIDRRRYLCPNSIVVSRGCPHHCDFCYKDAFYEGGISFYTQAVDRALAEIDRLPGQARLLPRRPPARQPALRRRRCSRGCAGWAASSRARAPSTRSCART